MGLRAGSYCSFLFVCEVAAHPSTSVTLESPANRAPHPASDTSANMPETYMLVQRTDLIRIKYVLVYTEHGRLGSLTQSASSRHASAGLTERVQPVALPCVRVQRRADGCAVLIGAYLVMMLAIGFAQTNSWRMMFRVFEAYAPW